GTQDAHKACLRSAVLFDSLEAVSKPNKLAMGRKGHECEASLRYPALNEPSSSDHETGVPFAAHRRRHGIDPSALSQPLEGSFDPVLAVAPSIWVDSVSSRAC